MPRNFLRLSPEKTALFLFGVFFIAVLLILAVAIPEPTQGQWRVFNVVLALVAAAIATIIPGVLHLQFTPWLRAGGALAVFALVYLVKPAGLVASDPFELPPPPPVEAAKPVVDRWLVLLDTGAYETAYLETFEGFRRRYAKADFLSVAQTVRSPLGRVLERKEVGQHSTESPFGDRGHVRVYMFLTQFERSVGPIEEYVTVFARDSQSDWLPNGYHVNTNKTTAQQSSTTVPKSEPEAETQKKQ